MFERDKYFWKKNLNYRKAPEAYRVGKGEQGVLMCEPYKSELLPYWHFSSPEIAQQSADRIYRKFIDYLSARDFVGADMARKFLQMGFTRARRYANYRGGKKYGPGHIKNTKGTGDPQKALSAQIFYDKWQEAEAHEFYAQLKIMWKEVYG